MKATHKITSIHKEDAYRSESFRKMLNRIGSFEAERDWEALGLYKGGYKAGWFKFKNPVEMTDRFGCRYTANKAYFHAVKVKEL